MFDTICGLAATTLSADFGIEELSGSNLSDVFGANGWTGAPLAEELLCVNLDAVKERFEKLAKRAKRLGVPVPGFQVVGQHEEYEFRGRDPVTGRIYLTWTKSQHESYGERRTGGARTVYHVVLLGCDTVKFAGWSFLAVLDHELGEDNTVVRKAPSADVELPPEWKHKNNFCDHCKRNQVRKQTFVCKHEDGRLVQVGSTCIKDFLGHDVAAALGLVEILALVRELFDSEDEAMKSDGEPKTYATVEYLAWVAKSIREGGWTSRAKARDTGCQATADDALSTMLEYRRNRGGK